MSKSIRKNPNIVRAIVLLVFILLALLVAIYYVSSSRSYVLKARKFLWGYEMTGLSIGSEKFDVKNGNVVFRDKGWTHYFTEVPAYRLAVFYKYFTENPLLADTDINVAIFDDAVNKFSVTQDEIKKFLGTSEDIVPVEIFRNFSKASQMASEFKSAPTKESASKYLISIASSADAYDRTIKSFDAAINKYANTTKKNNMLAGGSYTNFSTVKASIENMSTNANVLQKEVAARKNIFSGDVPPRLSAGEKIQAIDVIDSIALLPKEHLTVSATDLPILRGVYGVNTPCYDGVANTKYFYVYYKDSKNRRTIIPKVATTNYYKKVNKDSPLDRSYFEMGRSWRPLKEENSYYCLDNTYQVDILTMDKFLEKYPSEILSKIDLSQAHLGDSGDSVVLDAIKQEMKFYNSSIKTVNNYDSLAANYLIAYKLLIDAGGSINYEFAQEILGRYHFWFQKTGGIENIFSGTYQLDRFDELLPQNTSDKSQLRIFSYLVRPNYSISFFSFSKLYWMLDNKPKYLTTLDGKYNALNNLFDYDYLIKSGVADSELKY